MSQYEKGRANIQSAFMNGMDTLFRTLFTETCYFALMDTSATTTNVYDESTEKVYCTPKALTAKVVVSRKQGDEDVKTVEQTAEITVPALQLTTLNIPHTTQADLTALQKGVFKFNGTLFLVDKVVPKTMVADAYLFYVFSCTTQNKDGTVYTIPEV